MAAQCLAKAASRRPLLALSILVSIPLLVASTTIGLSGDPLLVSYLITTSIIIYAILSLVSSPLRLLPLAFALGSHVGALVSYYSDPLILPLMIIERGPDGTSINLDLVQILLLLEAPNVASPRHVCLEEGESKIGPEPGREESGRGDEARVEGPR